MAHIDSSGIGALLEGLRKASQLQVPFFLCGLNNAARRTLERTRLNRLFDICGTVEEALRRDAPIPTF
jgi:anti-anti-sigma factor